jgi:hypothetical protein
MKAATTITTTILVLALGAGLALAQSPTIIQNTRNQMNGVSSHSTAASNVALGKSQPAPATVSVKPAPAKGSAAAASSVAKTTGAKTAKTTQSAVAVKPAVAAGKAGHAKVAVAVKAAPKKAAKASAPVTAKAAVSPATSGTGENTATEQPVVPDSKATARGRRDPFISPVVSRAGGSGCSNGKKCLEIGTINLKGVVHSENGFIAVVSNNLNKAYFLRENDPVFDGYVVKITGDSIVFQETLQDRLGKSFTREVVKKLTTPAV